jgi:hypothetical protein
MTDDPNFNHGGLASRDHRLALAACLIFGIIVLASGDWLPGGIIVTASTVGLARAIPTIRDLCSAGSRSRAAC